MLKRSELLICQQTSRHKGRSPASTGQKSLWMASDSVLKAWKQFGETSNIGELAGLATISAAGRFVPRRYSSFKLSPCRQRGSS